MVEINPESEVKFAQEVYYPWDLTKKFDYGYFPFKCKKTKEKNKEIWDWFVVAEKGAPEEDAQTPPNNT